jgi:hypothetical protein
VEPAKATYQFPKIRKLWPGVNFANYRGENNYLDIHDYFAYRGDNRPGQLSPILSLEPHTFFLYYSWYKKMPFPLPFKVNGESIIDTLL